MRLRTRKVTLQRCDETTGRWEHLTFGDGVVVVVVVVVVNGDDDSYGRSWYIYTHTHTQHKLRRYSNTGIQISCECE